MYVKLTDYEVYLRSEFEYKIFVAHKLYKLQSLDDTIFCNPLPEAM